MLDSNQIENKMQTADTVKEQPVMRVYNFPEHGLSVEATSIENAQAELEKILNKKIKQ